MQRKKAIYVDYLFYVLLIFSITISYVLSGCGGSSGSSDSSHLDAFAGGDQYVDVGTTVTLDASGSEGDIQTYAWQLVSQAGQSNSPLSGTGVILSFTLDEPDSVEYELTISDGSSTDTDICIISSNSPEINSIEPISGSVGTSVTVSGNNFSPTNDQNEVLFNEESATVTSSAITQLVASVPPSASTGPISITVLGNGDSVLGPDFTVTAATPGTWVLKESNAPYALWGVSFPDDDTGVAVGADGNIVRSEDGGDTWTNQPHDYGTVQLRDVWFTTPNIGTAVGSGGTILRTEDGGANWTKQQSNTGVYLFGVCFVDNDTGWTFGNKMSGGGAIIVKTIDGGDTWIPGETMTPYNIDDIFFVDADRGWISGDRNDTGDAFILRTTNGGENWTPAETIPEERYAGSLFFVDSDNGWSSGSKLQGGTAVMHTSDGGITWVDQSDALPAGAVNYAYDVHFLDLEIGMIAGTGGFVYRTEDGGNSWVEEANPAGTNIHAIVLLDNITGIAVGNIRSFNEDGLIMRRE